MDCDVCGGEGTIVVGGRPGNEIRRDCPHCYARREWGGVMRAAIPSLTNQEARRAMTRPDVASGLLEGLLGSSVFLRGSNDWMLGHLGYAVLQELRVPRRVEFGWVSDYDLMGAHFGKDAHRAKETLMRPARMLVVELGRHLTRNEVASQVLYEALRMRQGRPTWVFVPDDLDPRTLPCWSPQVERWTSGWDRVHEGGNPEGPNLDDLLADL